MSPGGLIRVGGGRCCPCAGVERHSGRHRRRSRRVAEAAWRCQPPGGKRKLDTFNFHATSRASERNGPAGASQSGTLVAEISAGRQGNTHSMSAVRRFLSAQGDRVPGAMRKIRYARQTPGGDIELPSDRRGVVSSGSAEECSSRASSPDRLPGDDPVSESGRWRTSRRCRPICAALPVRCSAW